MRRLLILMLFLLALLPAGCERGKPLGTLITDGPEVWIDDPPSGARVPTGQEVRIRSTATDPRLVERIELYINQDLVAEEVSPLSEGQVRFSTVQSWVPTEPGQAEVVVYAYNMEGEQSRPAAIMLEVVGASLATPRPTSTVTPSPSPATLTPATSRTPTPSPTPVPVDGIEGRVSALGGLNVRNGPATTAARIDGLNYDDAVTAVARTPDAAWVKIRYGPDRQEGWVATKFVAWRDDIERLPEE